MKLIKGISFVLAGLFVVITLFSLLMPSTVRMVRSTRVHAPADSVFARISDLKEWKRWHPVFNSSNFNGNWSSPSQGKGAFVRWSSGGKENALTIESDSAHVLEATLQRQSEKPATYYIMVMPVNNPGEVAVEWRTVVKLGWLPWEKFSGMMLDKITGPGYEQALDSLKMICEQ